MPFLTTFIIIKIGTIKLIKKRIETQRGTEFVNISIAENFLVKQYNKGH
jgi:hypothetical protein